MSDLHLIIGNRNYSSWSLRPWMLMRHLGLSFRETVVPLDHPETKAQIAQYGPGGRVPVLHHGKQIVWDSLAICEYLAEISGRGWPTQQAARACARSIAAEMHSGFATLRNEWPMNARAQSRHTPMTAALAADIARIDSIWTDCRQRFGQTGPWLFGSFTAADAMYAPVVLRFVTYGAQLSQTAARYVASALEDPPLQDWIAAAQGEPWTIPHAEIG
jgi:glutathione S-transferase